MPAMFEKLKQKFMAEGKTESEASKKAEAIYIKNKRREKEKSKDSFAHRAFKKAFPGG